MIIKGKPIADSIYQKLTPPIHTLRKRKIIPTLSIILVGNNKQSVSYVNSKKIHGEKIGIKVLVDKLDEDTTELELNKIINNYNNDVSVHGIIVQLPLPSSLNEVKVINWVSFKKDVDGFLTNSLFINPLARAVLEILKRNVGKLDNKQICLIGKGRTGGGPIYSELQKVTRSVKQIDTSTKNPDDIIKSSDIVISCVGKKRVVNSKNCKKGAILINCGLHSEDGILMGDYDEDEIKDIAHSYTPTPGGIGPVNVAFLLENVVKACRV